MLALDPLAPRLVGAEDLRLEDGEEGVAGQLLPAGPPQRPLGGGVGVGGPVVHGLQQPRPRRRVLHPGSGPARAVLREAPLHAAELLECVGDDRRHDLVLGARVEEPVRPRRRLQRDRVRCALDRRLDARLEGVGPAAQDDAVLGERPRRGLDDLVERTPPQGDLLEAEADVHVVAGVDGVVHAAGLDVRDALEHEQLLPVQRGGCARDAEDAPLHHVLQPRREPRGAVLRDADGLLLLALHGDQEPGGGAVPRGTLQVEQRGDAGDEWLRRRDGAGRLPGRAHRAVGAGDHVVRRHPAIVLPLTGSAR